MSGDGILNCYFPGRYNWTAFNFVYSLVMITCCDASACFPRLGVIVGDVKLLFVRMDVDDSGPMPSPRCPRAKWCSDMMFLPDLIAILPHSPNFPEGLSGHKHVDSEIDSFCELHRSKWPYGVSACTEFWSISTLNFESRRNAQLLSTLLSLNHLLFSVRLPFNFLQFLPAL